MAGGSNKMIGDFSAKPATDAYAREIDGYVRSLGPVTRQRRAQVSYRVKRKFLWLWVYEQTADGTLFLSVLLDHEHPVPGVQAITRSSPNRWSHSVVLRSPEAAASGWLRELIGAGYEFAT
ncbi:DUF5655 domain-containing protein [Corynebacterium guangdongense]|uniref:DUF5655 domain-containing protein n=1 Tax=Corynebacterium guangdongense TaxID=1783348 RepID=A0ABU1ZZQ3_9CORY|nr:DUF5655 domain-containing protein [Corynebacterium guangdongense]MDR7330422.1 hypothetical protein [Corynebacterium guangdongense]WJZ18980.1 hypothetical protein CGUA_12225 [Corynebacterium guangdongense]